MQALRARGREFEFRRLAGATPQNESAKVHIMKMRDLVPLFEFSAAHRRADAQHAMSLLVVENMGRIVDSSYFRRFGMLEARIAREKAPPRVLAPAAAPRRRRVARCPSYNGKICNKQPGLGGER